MRIAFPREPAVYPVAASQSSKPSAIEPNKGSTSALAWAFGRRECSIGTSEKIGFVAGWRLPDAITINEACSSKGSNGVGRLKGARALCAEWQSKLDYAARPVRDAPRGWKSGGSCGARSCNLPARAEGEKRLRSATKKPYAAMQRVA